jgi:serine protease Do
MKKSIIPILGMVLLHGTAVAQDDIPLLRPEERQAVDAQADEFNESLKPLLAESAKSTVRVWSGKRLVAYGTVIGDGTQVLTKWSEVARANGNLRVESGAGDVLAAKVTGVYEDEDLAVLTTTGTPLTPVKWSTESPALGSFLATPQPNGKPAAFGVVSVLERNLRETDQAYLGVEGDPAFDGPGVKVRKVAPESGAAAAGLKPGSVILKVGERPISGVLELKNALVGVNPGSTVKLLIRSGKDEQQLDVLLGNRPDLPNFPGDRLRQMERMGGPISRVRDSFTRVIQTDMRPPPDQIGGPVVDLKGRVVGITMARADRTRSFVMPSAAVQELLKKPAVDPSLAQVRNDDENSRVSVRRPVPRIVPPPGGMRPGDPERMRQHLTEMQRLMDFMREEMETLEPQGR